MTNDGKESSIMRYEYKKLMCIFTVQINVNANAGADLKLYLLPKNNVNKNIPPSSILFVN